VRLPEGDHLRVEAFFEKEPHILDVLVHAHADEHQAVSRVACAQRLEVRQRGAARVAPARPEVEEDDQASELRQGDVLTVEILDDEARRRLSNLLSHRVSLPGSETTTILFEVSLAPRSSTTASSAAKVPGKA
jgi:hypothetical protein